MAVSVLGFGGAEIGFEQASVEQTARLLGSALDAGLNVIDTAAGYSESESLIGQSVSHRRGEYFLFTKCPGGGAGMRAWDESSVLASIDQSLTRLKTDCLDLVQLHSCDLAVLQQGDIIVALQKARATGKTRFIGYSGENEAAEYAVSCGAFDTLQTSVNLADQRGLERWVKSAKEAEMGIIAKRPIANACWKWATEEECPAYPRPYWQRLQALAYEDLSIERALRFTLTVPGVTTAIVGTKNPERWTGNAALAEQGLLSVSEYEAIRLRWQEVAQDDWLGQV